MTYEDIHGPQAKHEVLVLAEQLTDLVASTIAPEVMGTYSHVVVPEGYTVKELSEAVEKQQDAPNRKRGVVQLKSLKSLLDYMEDMNASDGAILDAFVYANPDQRTITTVFNDHKNGGGWRDHRAVFSAEFTPEFKKWMEWPKLAKVAKVAKNTKEDRITNGIQGFHSCYSGKKCRK